MPADSSRVSISRDPNEPLPCGCLIEVVWLDERRKYVHDNPGAGQAALDKGCTHPCHDSYRFIRGVSK